MAEMDESAHSQVCRKGDNFGLNQSIMSMSISFTFS